MCAKLQQELGAESGTNPVPQACGSLFMREHQEAEPRVAVDHKWAAKSRGTQEEDSSATESLQNYPVQVSKENEWGATRKLKRWY